MVEAVRASDGLFVVAGFEPGATAPTDLAVFAQERAASLRAQLVEDGHTVVTEQLQPRTESIFSYALATDIEGHRMLQYHTERFDPFPPRASSACTTPTSVRTSKCSVRSLPSCWRQPNAHTPSRVRNWVATSSAARM